jgi:Cu/Ag efflux protein CusF
MTPTALALRAVSALALAASLALADPPAASAQAAAHATTSSPGSFTRAQKVSATFTVESVDLATRHVTLKRPSGERMTLQASKDVRNLEALKPGDTINALYYAEMEIALAQPGQPLPEEKQRVVSSRAKEGELPGGVVATHMVVNGAVVGVDKAKNRVKLVSPQGGQVHEFDVTSPEGRAMLQRLKPGDKITARITEGMLISADRG